MKVIFKVFLLLTCIALLAIPVSATTQLYLTSNTASGAMPNAKVSTDTITNDLATTYATYNAPSLMTIGNGTLNRSNQATVGNLTTHYTHYGSWITQPLQAQTINGTPTVGLIMNEGNATSNNYPRITVYRWTANDTFGGNIIGLTTSTTEVPSTWPGVPTVYFNNIVVPSTTFANGDKIVIEIESQDSPTTIAASLHGLRYNGPYSAFKSYVTFSDTLSFM